MRNVAWGMCVAFMLAGSARGDEVTADQKQYMDEYMKVSRAEADKIYAEFNRFCLDTFGASREPLMYKKCGDEFQFVEAGAWRHVSGVSACIAFTTSLPARASVKYQQAGQPASTTPTDERYFFNHIHYLRGLELGKEYTFTLIGEDERGKKIESAPVAFKADKPADAMDFPGEIAGPPYVITKPGRYLLTKDLISDAGAIRIKATGEVTLDLNGHAVTYNEKRVVPPGGGNMNFNAFIAAAPFGIIIEHPAQAARIFNGTIRQGEGAGGGQGNGWGNNPVFAGGANIEIAGVTIDHYGPSSITVNAYYAKSADLHHNVILDEGTVVINRHQGIKAIYVGKGTLRYNLVKRCRHQGLLCDGEIAGNEVYVDSYANNAFALALPHGGSARDNFVFGTGYHVCGTGWGSNQSYVGNFIHLKAVKPLPRFAEYGERSTMVGMRFTVYADGMDRYENTRHEGNVVIVSAAEGGEARGIQWSTGRNTANRVFKNNIIKAVAMDEKSTAAAAEVEGNYKFADELLPMVYEDSTFIGTTYLVQFGAGNPGGSNHRFVGCRFERVGKDSRFETLRFHQGFATKSNLLRDCEFLGGASLDSVVWPANYENPKDKPNVNFTVEWTATIKTDPKCAVEIADKSGKQVFTGVSDDKGELKVPLGEYVNSAAGKTDLGPYEVTAKKASGIVKKSLTAKPKAEISL